MTRLPLSTLGERLRATLGTYRGAGLRCRDELEACRNEKSEKRRNFSLHFAEFLFRERNSFSFPERETEMKSAAAAEIKKSITEQQRVLFIASLFCSGLGLTFSHIIFFRDIWKRRRRRRAGNVPQ